MHFHATCVVRFTSFSPYYHAFAVNPKSCRQAIFFFFFFFFTNAFVSVDLVVVVGFLFYFIFWFPVSFFLSFFFRPLSMSARISIALKLER